MGRRSAFDDGEFREVASVKSPVPAEQPSGLHLRVGPDEKIRKDAVPGTARGAILSPCPPSQIAGMSVGRFQPDVDLAEEAVEIFILAEVRRQLRMNDLAQAERSLPAAAV